jgi:hypothetical protein
MMLGFKFILQLKRDGFLICWTLNSIHHRTEHRGRQSVKIKIFVQCTEAVIEGLSVIEVWIPKDISENPCQHNS